MARRQIDPRVKVKATDFYLNHKNEKEVTLKSVAKMYGVNYCTLHTWVREEIYRHPEANEVKKLPEYEKIEMKDRCENDLLYLVRDILGYGWNPEVGEGIMDPPDRVHVEMIKLINRPERFKLGLFPRFSYKTRIITIGLAIQFILKNPNNTVLIVSERHKLAKKILKEIKGHLLTNKKLIDLYGDFLPNPKNSKWRELRFDKLGELWNRNEIYINQRTEIRGITEPSIGTSGADCEVTGTHPKVVILDDLVGPKNITTFEQKQKVKDYVTQTLHLIGKKGRLYMVGTPWAFDDVYSEAQENWLGKDDADTGRKLFAFRKLGVVDDETGELIMPSKYDAAYIKTLKETMPIFEYNCQYQCNPKAEGNTLMNFNRDLKRFMYHRLFDIFGDEKNYPVYMALDPGESQHAKKCYTGLIVGIPKPPHDLYIDYAARGRWRPSEILEHIMELIEIPEYRTHEITIGVEEVSFQKVFGGSLIQWINEKIYETNAEYLRRVSVVPVIPDDNKHKRIYRIEMYVRNHQIHIKYGLDELVIDISSYPHLGHNKLDILDAMEMLLRIIPPFLLRNPYAIIKREHAETPKTKIDRNKYDVEMMDEFVAGVPAY